MPGRLRSYARACACISAWVFVLAVSLPAGAAAQIGFGGYLVRAADAFDGTTGVGARVTLDAPLFPVGAALNAERFFPDCGGADCSLWGLTIDANIGLNLIVVKPWAGVGWSIRSIEVAGVSATERGFNVGAGAELNLARLHPFLEFRYELAEAPEKQLFTRIGLVYR